MDWTEDNVPDLSGQTIVITGANSGIGFEAARVCVARSAHTILACRNEEKGNEAVASIRANDSNKQVEFMHLDLSQLASVKEFSKNFLQRFTRLDALVNNAGIMMAPYQTTKDGFESQLGVNHLGHFALTGLVLPSLLAAPAARIVNISSSGHRLGKMDFNNLLFEGGKGYGPIKAYGRSKLANLLFTSALQKRLASAGTNAIAVAAHPGAANTNLGHYLEKKWYLRPFLSVGLKFAQSSAMGALPTLRALVDPTIQGGEYFGPGGFREQRGYPVQVGSSKAAQDATSAERLWNVSEELTGVHYDWNSS